MISSLFVETQIVNTNRGLVSKELSGLFFLEPLRKRITLRFLNKQFHLKSHLMKEYL